MFPDGSLLSIGDSHFISGKAEQRLLDGLLKYCVISNHLYSNVTDSVLSEKKGNTDLHVLSMTAYASTITFTYFCFTAHRPTRGGRVMDADENQESTERPRRRRDKINPLSSLFFW